MKFRPACVAVAYLPLIACAQDLPRVAHDAAKAAESLFAQQDSELNYEEFYETILQYLSSPIDINKATEAELRSLFLMSDQQVMDLLAHRAANGELLSVYELQSIASFPPEFIRRLAQFITVASTRSSSNLFQRIKSEPNNYLMSRYERILQPGAAQSSQDSLHRFTGSPDRYTVRFRVSHPGDFSLGFMAEKDPGEKSLADYNSFHFQRVGRKRLLNIIVGDFQAHFGQGLTLGGGFGMGKGSETILTMRRNTLGFIPWTSSGETGFFRGAGASIALSRSIVVHGFVSHKRQDAVIRLDADSVPTASLQSTGFHRNAIEKAARNAVNQDNAGVVLELRKRSLQAGVILLHTRWDMPLAGGQDIYNRFGNQDRLQTNASAFASYSFRNLSLFGETTKTIGSGIGAITGVLASVNRYTDISVVFRSYARNYGSPYGSAIAENSTAKNEKGIYWGWKFQPSKAWTLAAYIDLFRFPWLQYRSYSTSASGHDGLFRTTWKPRKEIVVFAQIREERKSRNNSTSGPIALYQTSIGIKRNYCLNADYSLGMISLRTRVQASTLKESRFTSGFALSQDFSLERPRWSLSVRQVLFDTDNFDNSQYCYEPDMWMAYSFPGYSGTGTRSMAMVRIRISRKADLWLRWAQTRRVPGVADPTQADVTDLKVQIRVKM